MTQNPVLQRAIDLDFVSELPGFALTLADIHADEFQAIKVIRAERDKYRDEQLKKK